MKKIGLMLIMSEVEMTVDGINYTGEWRGGGGGAAVNRGPYPHKIPGLHYKSN